MTKKQPPAKKAARAPAKPRIIPTAPPAPTRVAGTPITRREIPRGQIWCGPCAGLADEEGSERTPHGFTFCRKHRSK